MFQNSDSQITTTFKVTTGLPILDKIIKNFFPTLEKIAKKNDIDYILPYLSLSIGGLMNLL